MKEKDWYWLTKLGRVEQALKRNGIAAVVTRSGAEAREKALSLIRKGASVGLGGSRTLAEIGLLEALRGGDYGVHDQYDPKLSKEESMRLRKEGTHAEYFVSGSNAVAEDGKIVNIDGLGNRLAGLCFGPDKVIIVVGRNKITKDLAAAIDRARNVAAPMNATRFGLGTPCTVSGVCEDCESPERICNVMLIIEKQRLKDRMTVILVNEDLGF